ncbi:ABC transporter [Parashewanella spongiae]|uniref:ABC transporter n=1 Tax=Parashewanella spongiae TaxID=342950 RepID=A0A3A6TRS0_9GAMM|nr:ABC transporter [Parashewanella spongiae]
MIANTLLIANFELRKLFFQRRGIIALACFTLVWALILFYPVKSAAELILVDGFKEFTSGFAHSNNAEKILNWPVAEMSVYWVIALLAFPIFSLILTADQFASDKQRGTLRFLLLRSQRDSIYFGRFLAQIYIQATLIIISVVATIILATYREFDLLLPALSIGTLVSVALIINLLPYTALLGVFSLYAKGARQATILAILLMTIVSIVFSIINYYLPQTGFINLIKPGEQIFDMINTQGVGVLSYSLIPLLQTVAILTFGRFYIQRKAL